jgi:D-alanyl-D-alanine carboxypeptidase/D-alanyl-D-alanine-endopeptidase (penicillin-binding protein 4)
MTFTKSFVSILLILLGFSIASGQNPAQVRKLKKELAKITGSKEFKTATIGFCLMDVETGKILAEENSEKSLIPASTMKLITTGAGLALLGDTFRFKTELGYTGNVSNGRLDGRIVFNGYGDPTFGSEKWDTSSTLIPTIISAIKNADIKNISSNILILQDVFRGSSVPPGIAFEDISWYYGSPVYAFNYKENSSKLFLDTLQVPDLTDPGILHDTVYYNTHGENLFVDYSTKLSSKDIRENNYAVHNPSLKFLLDLYQYANSNSSITIQDPDWKVLLRNNPSPLTSAYSFISGKYASNLNLIKTFYSPSLLDITTKTNHSSINLYAEGILRALSTNKYGYSTLDSSISIAKKFWKNEVGDLKGLRMTDGSGLSRSNLCTPLLFCKMLTSYTKRDNFDSFYSTIPVAGKDGTVKNFAKGTAADGNAHIKSGSMSRVKCYAGYVTGKNGKLYAVSVMFNNFEPDSTVTAACANLIGKVAELKGGKPKKTFVVNRGK